MNFELTEQEQAFRDRLRQWLQDNLPEGWGKTVFEPVDYHELDFIHFPQFEAK